MRLSRSLSHLLRYGASEQGLDLVQDGFVSLAEVIRILGPKRNWPKRLDTTSAIREVVANSLQDDGQPRFEIKTHPAHLGMDMIRATCRPLPLQGALAREETSASAEASCVSANAASLEEESVECPVVLSLGAAV